MFLLASFFFEYLLYCLTFFGYPITVWGDSLYQSVQLTLAKIFRDRSKEFETKLLRRGNDLYWSEWEEGECRDGWVGECGNMAHGYVLVTILGVNPARKLD